MSEVAGSGGRYLDEQGKEMLLDVTEEILVQQVLEEEEGERFGVREERIAGHVDVSFIPATNNVDFFQISGMSLWRRSMKTCVWEASDQQLFT